MEDPGQDLALDHFARGGFATGEEAHYVCIAVELDQIVGVCLGEPAQQETVRFQERLELLSAR